MRCLTDGCSDGCSQFASASISRRSAIGLMAGAAALFLSGCSLLGEPPYVSPYDWSCLRQEGEALIYAPDGVADSRWGIDVSAHQHAIDWTQVAASGVQFAFVRAGNRGATEGDLYEDETFLVNAVGAQEAGISVSSYFFSQALDAVEAHEEAAHFLDLLAKAEAHGVAFEAVAFDHESVNVEGARANDLDGRTLSSVAITFCEDVQAAGYQPFIYGNQRDLGRLDKVVREAYPLWLAEYETNVPTAQFDFRIWQYSKSGIVPGIDTDVDLDLWLPPVR